MFGLASGTAVASTIALAIGLPILTRRLLGQRSRIRLGLFLAGLVTAAYASWIIKVAVSGGLDARLHLPLHLCWVANLMLPIAMSGRAPKVFEVVYYWGLAAGIQATLTPIVPPAFSPEFVIYALQHNGMVIVLVYGVVACGFQPTAAGILVAFLVGNLVVLMAIPTNILLGSNYLFICNKPATSTLLDYCGPWPWYVLAGEGLALLHFAAAYIAFWIVNRFVQAWQFTDRPA